MKIKHPRWCEPTLCTATEDTGEHRSDLVDIDTLDIEPAPPAMSVQLVQPAAIGGGTAQLVIQLGADRWALPTRVAQDLVDQAVTLLWHETETRVAA